MAEFIPIYTTFSLNHKSKKTYAMKKYTILLLFMLSSVVFADSKSENNPVTAINNFDPSQYLGKWYEIARIPFYFEDNCRAPVIAQYEISGDNISVTNSCVKDNNEISTSNGLAYFVESQSVAKLTVTFLPAWLRFTHLARGDYWVLYTDYNYSLVGSPNHKYLWILSRTELPDQAAIDNMISIAKKQGFNTDSLLFNYKQYQPK